MGLASDSKGGVDIEMSRIKWENLFSFGIGAIFLANLFFVVGSRPANVQATTSVTKTLSSQATDLITQAPEKQIPIMGKAHATKKQMVAYYQRNNSSYPYAGTNVPTIQDFVQTTIDEANYEGVRADVAFALMMHETGFLKFGRDVSPSQYNFGGIGATGGGVPGNSFPNPQIGIRAVVQHLKAYATTAPLNRAVNNSKWETPYADPRYDLVDKGSVPLVNGLGSGKWAVDQTYGASLLNQINYMVSLK